VTEVALRVLIISTSVLIHYTRRKLFQNDVY